VTSPSSDVTSPVTTHVLTLTCPDRPGIGHAVCGALLDVGANIVENAQFGEPDTGTFCMRTVFESSEADAAAIAALVSTKLGVAEAVIRVRRAQERPRILIMVSKFDHCLVDLLYRWRTGALPVEIAVIVSNHSDCGPLAAAHGIPFVHLPVTTETKPTQEAALVELVATHSVDLVVLARYMQILSNDLCRALAGRAINIHHSFLPGFKGARPYHQAHHRGVKLIGATAHFVTGDLDEGPIIEQDVVRVTHAHTAEQLTSMGQDVERLVLTRAVRLWSEDRILLVGDKTVVFG
jgi:formyltetrahydrofolate deformylase